ESDKLELKLETVNLPDLAGTVVQQFEALAKSQGSVLRLESEPEAMYVRGDRHRLERVLGNVLSNAIKYTNKTVERGRKGQIVVRVARQEDGCSLMVADNGPGMTAEDLEKIGQAYTRLDSARGTAGTGIGLYVSRGVVAAHGGTITFASEGPD